MRPFKVLEQSSRYLDETASIETILDRIHMDCKEIRYLSTVGIGNESMYNMVTNILSSIGYHFSLLMKKLLPEFIQTKNYTEKSLRDLKKIHKNLKKSSLEDISFVVYKDMMYPVFPGLKVSLPVLVNTLSNLHPLYSKNFIDTLKNITKMSKNTVNGSMVSDVKMIDLYKHIVDNVETSRKELQTIVDVNDNSDRRKLAQLVGNIEELLKTTDNLLEIENPVSDMNITVIERHVKTLNDNMKMMVNMKRQTPEKIKTNTDIFASCIESFSNYSATVSAWYQIYQHAVGTSDSIESHFFSVINGKQ